MIFSGPPSCLCSTPEGCEITEDNVLDFVPSVAEVTIKIFQIFLFDILILFIPGVSLSGDVRCECRVWILHLVKYQPTSWRFIFIPDMSGTTLQNQFWPTCVSCSPAALRKTPRVPPVTLLRYPAVNTLALQQQPLPPPPPSPQLQPPQHQHKVKT